MTEIKICGITRLEDALCACESGADALGFIFSRQSPRFISPERARAIIAALPRTAVTVGVFVNEPAEKASAIAAETGIDLLQFHGDESPAYCRAFPAERLIKAVSPAAEADLAALAAYSVRAFLIDARCDGLYGGTGRKADWGLAATLAARVPLILAGGLNDENIAAALARVRPKAVDLSSGVEQAPGIKDHDCLRHLCALVHKGKPAGRPEIFRKGRKES